MVTEIAAGAQEQATGLQQVNTAVNQMDQVTQQNAAMVEEATAASRSLAQESEQLTSLIGQFQVGQSAAEPMRRRSGSRSRMHAVPHSDRSRPGRRRRRPGVQLKTRRGPQWRRGGAASPMPRRPKTAGRTSKRCWSGWREAARTPTRQSTDTYARGTETTMTEIAHAEGAMAQELIAFRIGEQEFCVDVMSVREIRGWTPATPVPKAPSFVRGVINLRGTVLPIVDLAARLGFAPAEPTARHAIMVAQVGRQVVGLLVDGRLRHSSPSRRTHIQPTPDVASDMAKTFVRGVIVMDGRLISLIALENLLPPGQLAAA